MRYWITLGWPVFLSVLAIFYLMVRGGVSWFGSGVFPYMDR